MNGSGTSRGAGGPPPGRAPHAHHAGHAPRAERDPVAGPGTIYTCPMHPEIRQESPGQCPKCGMTLEPVLPGPEADEGVELRDVERRFRWTLPLTATVTVLAMSGHRLDLFSPARQSWIELAL